MTRRSPVTGIAVQQAGPTEVWQVRGPARLEGSLHPPGDKSIAHRALILAALARGTSTLTGMPAGEDVARTRDALVALGVRIDAASDAWRVHGVGLHGLRAARAPIDCGNSGTTMRLLAGLLAAQHFETVLTGDSSLVRRPMQRVVVPLRRMGAGIECLGPDGRPPLRVGGATTEISGVRHRLDVDSAQVRSAILLAGLRAAGPTRIEPASQARDHTERLLEQLGVRIDRTAGGLVLYPTLPKSWSAFDFDVPGDLSSALFAIAAAGVLPGSRLQIDRVGLNPGRRRALEILAGCGAQLDFAGVGSALGEPWGTVRVAAGRLRDLELKGTDVVRCIDEIPALAAAWAIAGRRFRLRDAAELRVKESDRIASLAAVLAAFGARVAPRPDGFLIEPGASLRPAPATSRGDHRIAMAAAIVALAVPGTSRIDDVGCVRTSYPDFARDLNRLAHPARQDAGRNGASGAPRPRPPRRRRAAAR